MRNVSTTDEAYQKFIERLLSDENALARLQAALGERKLVYRDELTEVLEEIKHLREDTNKRFEAVDKRFEELIQSMNKKFDAVDKRFEAVDKRFEELIQSMNNRFDYLNLKIDSIGNRSGTLIEKGIIKILREILIKEGLRAEDIEKIEKLGIRDREGKFLYPNAKIDIDGYIANEKHIIMEIKFKPTKQDVQSFYRKKEAFKYYKKIEPEQWLVAVEITESVKELAEDLGIKVIYMKLVEPYL